MRPLFLARVCGPLILATSIPAYAQVPMSAPTASTSEGGSAPVVSQTPAAPAPQTPEPAAPTPQNPQPAAPAAQNPEPAAPTVTGPLAEESRSLFAPSWNTFQFSGRLSSITGDQARWQRYEDLRDGVLFTGARFLRETTDWSLKAGADNVGWLDQRYFANYERIGRLKVSGLWDEIPQFYSIDTAHRVHVRGRGRAGAAR